MRKFSLSMLAVVAFTLTTTAQIINVTGGPGRVNNNTVIEGLPFTATVTGLNGTPQRWTVGIGTVGTNNDLILNTSATSISNAIVGRPISGNTAVISVGATNGRGVSRFLNVQPPATPCTSEIIFLTGANCSFVAALVNPEPIGATNYSWSVSPSIPFSINNGGRSISFSSPFPGANYNVTVSITGGNCNGVTLNETVQCSGGGELLNFDSPIKGIEDKRIENIQIFPNPVSGDELNLNFGRSADEYQLSIFSGTGEPIEGISIEKQGNSAKLGINNLTPGIYYIRTVNAEGIAETQRFRVE